MIFDAHLDLAMNAIEWNRDLTQSVDAIRQREQGMTDKLDRTRSVVSLPAMRHGQIGLCIATQIARYSHREHPLPGWHSPEIAWAVTQAQRIWYETMVESGQMVQITDVASLDAHLALWKDAGENSQLPVGYILSLEGADSLVTLDYLGTAFDYGLRAIGPAHYGPGRYCPGTGSTGGFTDLGRELLAAMEQLGIVLDATHLTDEAFWEAMESFNGAVWASHSNCRTLVPDQRQFNDEQILALAERKAVIGVVLDAWMLSPGWQRGVTDPIQADVKLSNVVDHIDHLCQLMGHAQQVGIGSDLDGGYGREQCPHDLEEISDLQKISRLLEERGYSPSDIAAIMHGNWIRRVREIWSG